MADSVQYKKGNKKKPPDRFGIGYGIPRTEQTRHYSMRESEDQDRSVGSMSQPNNKTPVILTKPTDKNYQSNSAASTPDGDKTGSWNEISSSPTNAIAPKLSMTFKKTTQTGSGDKKNVNSRTDTRVRSGVSPHLVKQSLAQATQGSAPNHSTYSGSDGNTSKKDLGANTKSCVKMLDASLNWSEAGLEMLQEQTDFLVIGVVGMQGVGKSTILSLLAGNQLCDTAKSMVFRPQSLDVRERAGHMTTGIDIAVTSERLILLDMQPILSSSISLEQSTHYERKSASDCGSINIETQSLQMTAFLLTVCHVVIVVQDWFTDSNIYKFLQVAEMLKPVTPPPSHDSPSIKQDPSELQPVVVFVHNKIETSMFNVRSIATMNEVMLNFINFSGLFCKSHLSLSETNLYPGLSVLVNPQNEVNSFILPDINDKENEEEKVDISKKLYDPADQQFLSLPQYAGRPNTVLLENCFRKMVLAIPRHSITHQILTEKNWFHYSARTWEAIRKSQLVSEYNRLLSG